MDISGQLRGQLRKEKGGIGQMCLRQLPKELSHLLWNHWNGPGSWSSRGLRHACGYYLANKGVDTRAIQVYMGHKSIVHTARYTELASDRFNDFWSD